MTFIHFDTVV